MSARQFSFKFGSAELREPCAKWSSVKARFFRSDPSYIVGSVWAVRVNSIKYMIRRSFAYVGQKISEVVPALADGYSTLSIIFILVMFWIIASSTHSFPCFIERVFFTMYCVAMYYSATAARFRVSITEIFSSDSGFITAVASAYPFSTLAFISANCLNRYQSTEALSCDINRFGHRTAPTVRGSSGEVSALTLASLRFIAG